MKYGVQLGGGASVSQRDSLKKVAAAAEHCHSKEDQRAVAL
jgi:hypothetical protein